MRFDELTKYFERLEAARGRLKMYKLLGELFSRAGKDEVAEIAYLLEARSGPPFAAVNIGMGERMVAAAVAAATKKSEAAVLKLYKELGDLGLVAQRLTPKNRRGKLTVSEVYSSLLEIARTSGRGSAEKKVKRLADLIGSVSPLSALYTARFVVGRMRLGVGAPTIIEAVARLQPDAKKARAVIERAYNLCSDLGLTLKTLRERGLEGLKKFKAHVGAPVRMMLAERLPNAEAIVKRLGRGEARRIPLPGSSQRSQSRDFLAQPRTHDRHVPRHRRGGRGERPRPERDNRGRSRRRQRGHRRVPSVSGHRAAQAQI
jgi:DNA ligase-1